MCLHWAYFSLQHTEMNEARSSILLPLHWQVNKAFKRSRKNIRDLHLTSTYNVFPRWALCLTSIQPPLYAICICCVMSPAALSGRLWRVKCMQADGGSVTCRSTSLRSVVLTGVSYTPVLLGEMTTWPLGLEVHSAVQRSQPRHRNTTWFLHF